LENDMREKSQVLSEFWIKILAILTMTLDHIGAFIVDSDWTVNFPTNGVAYGVGYVFRCVGRLSFPLFAFMLAEGMRKSHDRVKYLCRIGIVWLLLAAVETFFYFSPKYVSLARDQAFTDLLVFGLFIFCLELKGPKKLFALLPLGYVGLSFAAFTSEQFANATNATSYWSSYFPLYLRASYSLYGFLIFLGFYYAYPLADKFIRKSLEQTDTELAEYQKGKEYRSLVNLIGITFFLAVTVIYWGISKAAPSYDYLNMSIQTYGLLDIVFLVMYNGTRGYDKKAFRYIEYAYYPVHLALLALIFSLIFR